MRLIAAAAVLILAAPAFGQMPEPTPPGPLPPLSLPAEIKQTPDGDPLSLKPRTDAKRVMWYVPAGCWTRELDGGRELLIRARGTGRFVLLAFAMVGEELVKAECVLSVEAPTPEDAFRRDLAALLPAKDSPERLHLKALAALYRQSAEVALKDQELQTVGQLVEKVAKAGATMLPRAALEPYRKRVAQELAAAASDDGGAPLTPELREREASVFTRAAAVIEAAK